MRIGWGSSSGVPLRNIGEEYQDALVSHNSDVSMSAFKKPEGRLWVVMQSYRLWEVAAGMDVHG
jgi:hypothetical protein